MNIIFAVSRSIKQVNLMDNVVNEECEIEVLTLWNEWMKRVKLY